METIENCKQDNWEQQLNHKNAALIRQAQFFLSAQYVSEQFFQKFSDGIKA